MFKIKTICLLATLLLSANVSAMFNTREGPVHSQISACISAGEMQFGTWGTEFFAEGRDPDNKALALCRVTFLSPPFNPPVHPDVIYHVSVVSEPDCPDGQIYNEVSRSCASSPHSGEPNTGDPGYCEGSGNPIGFLRGNKYQNEIDFTTVNGPFSLDLSREYNSISNGTGIFGTHWRSDFDTKLLLDSISENLISVVRTDGQRERFHSNDDEIQIWQAVDHLTSRLVNNPDTTWTYTDEDDYTYVFDSTGAIQSVTTISGQQWLYTYNGSELQSASDSYGTQFDFNYNNGTLTSIQTPGGLFQYAISNDRVMSVTFPDGNQRTYHYDNVTYPTALTSIIDERGIKYVEWEYDSQGRAYVSRNLDQSGQTISEVSIDYTYAEAVNPRVIVTNELGKDIHYLFKRIAGHRKITEVQRQSSPNCGAAYRRVTYDPTTGWVTSRIDWKNVVTTYEYSAGGREIKRTEAQGKTEERVTTTEWHAAFNLPKKITRGGQETQYAYDSRGNLLQKRVKAVASQVDKIWNYTYNAQSLMTTADGPRTDVSDITTYTYDAQNQLATITDALGHVTTLSNYNAHGKPERIVDPNGVETILTYHTRGWLLTSTEKDPSGTTANDATTQYQYDGTGLLELITLPNGSSLNYEYDELSRVTAIENGLGERIEYSLDAGGNPTTEILKNSTGVIKKSLTRVYDELSRLIEVIDAAGRSTQFTYDANSNLRQTKNALNRTTVNAVDPLNRVISNTDALNNVTTRSIDNQDNVTAVTDARNITTQYVYDALDNLTEEISPATGSTVFTHDAAGNILTRTDAEGRHIQYQYDKLNRLVNESSPGTPLNKSYYYDNGNFGKGRVTRVEDASGSIDYVYDFLGRVISETRQIGAASYTTAYSHDKAGNVTTIDYPEGLSVSLTRNGEAQITDIQALYSTTTSTANQSIATGLTYLPFGPITDLTYGNGVTLSRSFDQDYRLTSHAISGVDTLSYTYNPVGSITAINRQVETGKSQTFDYDALERLTNETGPEGAKDYAYDSVGSRTSRLWTKPDSSTETQTLTYAVDSNQLETEDGSTVAYDFTGNITQRTVNGQTLDSGYDIQNRLASYQRNGQTVVRFVYNALGQRVQKIVTNGSDNYRIDFHFDLTGRLLGETVIDTVTGNKTDSRLVVWLDDMPIAQLSTSYDPSGAITSTQWIYLHADHLNTPRAATDNAQTIVWRWDSDAYGVGDTSSTQVTVNLRFPGQYFDKETGLHYNYFRDYDPTIGRYLQSDPIGLSDGPNTYAYVHGNPINMFDPNGESAAHAARFSFGAGWRIGRGINWAIEAGTGASLGAHIYNWTHDEWSDTADNHWIENEILESPVDGGGDNCDENRRKKKIMEKALDRQLAKKAIGQARQGRGFSNQAQVKAHRIRIDKIRKKLSELERAIELCPDEEDSCR